MNLTAEKRCWFASLLIACIFVSSFAGVGTVYASAPPNVANAVSAGLNYLDSIQQSDGCIGTFVFSSWATVAIVAAGEDPDSGRWLNGGGSVVDYLIANKGQLEEVDPYDYPCAIGRFIVSMTAAGEDPTNIAGTDYVAILKSKFVSGQIGETGKLNDDFWGVLALVSAGESVGSVEVQGSVSFIKANQNVDGGWGWRVGGSSDCDDTAAAVMALVAAGEDPRSQTLVKARQYLASIQMDDGGFPYNGESNSNSDSWVMGAIVSLGEHPAQWPLPSPSVVQHLLTLQNADGSFNDTSTNSGYGEDRAWTTSYAIQALCYNPYPVNVAPFAANLIGDLNDDNRINFDDITTFVNVYIAYYKYHYITIEEADFTHDGRMNFDDITDFVNYYIGFYS